MKGGNNPTGIFHLKVVGAVLTFLFKERIEQDTVRPEECAQGPAKSDQEDSKKLGLFN